MEYPNQRASHHTPRPPQTKANGVHRRARERDHGDDRRIELQKVYGQQK
jgi:hypothetical protein